MDGEKTEKEAVLTEAEHASLVSRFGPSWHVFERDGHRWVLKKPSRPQWQAYKCDANSADPTTKADAKVALARMTLVPFDPSGSVEAERAAFDAMAEDCPAMADEFGEVAWALGFGPLAVREVKPPPSSPRA